MEDQEEAIQHFQRVHFQQDDSDVVYLDSCTTSSTFVRERLLSDVKDQRKGLTVHCNTDKLTTNRRGDFGRLKVWAMKDGIANVLSLGEMIKLYRVTFDSLDGYFVVHMPGGVVHFTINEHGMPALDLRENPEAVCLLLQTVRSNYEGYTPREVKLARTAREAKATMASPSDEDMKNVVSSDGIENILFQKVDISNAKRILGPSLEETRGETTRTKPEHVKAKHVGIPAQVAERLKYMTISADIFLLIRSPCC